MQVNGKDLTEYRGFSFSDTTIRIKEIQLFKYSKIYFSVFRNCRRKSSSESALHRQVRFNNHIKITSIPLEEDDEDCEDLTDNVVSVIHHFSMPYRLNIVFKMRFLSRLSQRFITEFLFRL